jgi:hypothetical protein
MADFEPGACWATVWIEEFGAAQLWAGLERRTLEGNRIEVWWSGGEWEWAYEGEPTYLVDDECPGRVPDEYKNNPDAYVGVTPQGKHCRHWYEDGDDCCRCGATDPSAVDETVQACPWRSI